MKNPTIEWLGMDLRHLVSPRAVGLFQRSLVFVRKPVREQVARRWRASPWTIAHITYTTALLAGIAFGQMATRHQTERAVYGKAAWSF